MRDMLFSGDANAGCGAKARQKRTKDMGTNAPMMCTQRHNTTDPSAVKYPVNYQVWWLEGCSLRQVRVKPQSTAGTTRPPSMITHYLPDYRPEFQDRSLRSWWNGTYKEGWLDNIYKNRYG